MNKLSEKILSAVRDAVFPAKCIACGQLFVKSRSEFKKPSDLEISELLSLNEKHSFIRLMNAYLCSSCISHYTPVSSPFCVRCGMMFKERVSENHLCGNCIKKPGIIRKIRSAGIYDQSLLSAVRAFKYGKKIQLAEPLGALLFWVFYATYSGGDYPDLIIPVPLHKKKFRERKFNQAWLLLKDWHKFAEASKTRGDFRLKNKILLRKKQTKPQTGLDKKMRKANIKGAFSLGPSVTIKAKSILLIDDVYTTGATVNECAKVLIKGGASRVDVLTIARTQGG